MVPNILEIARDMEIGWQMFGSQRFKRSRLRKITVYSNGAGNVEI